MCDSAVAVVSLYPGLLVDSSTWPMQPRMRTARILAADDNRGDYLWARVAAALDASGASRANCCGNCWPVVS